MKSFEIEQEIMEVLDEWMAAFNRLDMNAWEQTMHFPHYRLASGKMTVQNGPGELSLQVVKDHLDQEEWHHSKWERRSIIHIKESKAHVDIRFVRYREDGSLIDAYDAIYILTREGGRWGVKLRSSFAPSPRS